MEDSIFTKIIRGEIPSYKVYEDERVYAFLDVYPVAKGHVLIVPKVQVQFLWDLEDDEYMAVMQAAKRISLHLRAVLNVPYIGERVIGVDVPHAHVHLIPFIDSKELLYHPDRSKEPDYTVLASMQERIRM
jgi:histidine triad (HIT) family protein